MLHKFLMALPYEVRMVMGIILLMVLVWYWFGPIIMGYINEFIDGVHKIKRNNDDLFDNNNNEIEL